MGKSGLELSWRRYLNDLIPFLNHLVFRKLVFDEFGAVGDQVLLNVPDAQHVVGIGENSREGIDQSLIAVRDDYFRKGNII